MTETYQEDKPAPIMPITARKVAGVFVIGALTGLILWGLTLFIDTYIVEKILCGANHAMQCASSDSYAEASASVISSAIGLFLLVRMQIFRPLLVALAAVVSLWGVVQASEMLPWYGIGLSAALSYALAYMLFTWIARIRLFWLVVLLMVVLVVAVRLTFSLQ